MTRTAEPGICCVIAEDHPPVLEALARLLSQAGIEVVGTARDGEEALALVRQLQPEVALVDVRLPRLSGLQVARRLRAVSAATRVLLYTGYGDAPLVKEGLASGASGLVLKESPVEEIVDAVRAVAGGKTYVDSAAARRLASTEGIPLLTPREREVLSLLASGLDTDEAASKLGITPHTLRTHIRNLMTKLGARTRPQAVAEGLRRGLIG
ncbi:MAG: DNA-binding response regulator [Meiothermus sp.]